MFNDKVMSFIFNIHSTLCADSSSRCPGIRPPFLMMMMMTTLKWPVSSLIVIDTGQAQKLCVPPCQNRREYLMQMMIRMMTKNSQPMFPLLPKSPSSQSQPRYILLLFCCCLTDQIPLGYHQMCQWWRWWWWWIPSSYFHLFPKV